MLSLVLLKLRCISADIPTMPLPLIPLALGILFGSAAKKKEGKEQFVAVKGRKRNDGSIGKATIRRRPKGK